MLKIYATFKDDGYIKAYRSDMEVEGYKVFEVEQFDHSNFQFYKKVEDVLVFDDKKYQAWISEPSIQPSPQKSLEEVILAKAETQTINIIMEMGLL